MPKNFARDLTKVLRATRKKLKSCALTRVFCAIIYGATGPSYLPSSVERLDIVFRTAGAYDIDKHFLKWDADLSSFITEGKLPKLRTLTLVLTDEYVVMTSFNISDEPSFVADRGGKISAPVWIERTRSVLDLCSRLSLRF